MGDRFLINCKEHHIQQTIKYSEWKFIGYTLMTQTSQGFTKIYTNSGAVYNIDNNNIIPDLDIQKSRKCNTKNFQKLLEINQSLR